MPNNPGQNQFRCECGKTFGSQGDLRHHEQSCTMAKKSGTQQGGQTSGAGQSGGGSSGGSSTGGKR